MRTIADKIVSELEQLSYEELVSAYRGRVVTRTAALSDETEAQIEIEVFEEAKGAFGPDLHVFVAVDDGGWSALFPVASGFTRRAGSSP